ncbi:MAG TPA: DUF2254 family protein, partial [Roseiarcus sp.]|nr:DUF2254 family protein [Roseiarcus sp.]
WAARAPPQSHHYDPPHVLRVVVPWADLDGLLDLAFEQLRHYAVADAAVSLRLMRALGDVAGASVDPAVRRQLLERGKRLMHGCASRLEPFDVARLSERYARLKALAR